MFSHISDIRRNKDGPVSRHFNNADSLFGGWRKHDFMPHRTNFDQGTAQRTKYFRLRTELYWIKILGTQFPHGINHKILRKHVIITFSFSSNVIKAFEITKNVDKKLQAIYPSIFNGELVCSFEHNRNLGDYLVSVKLKWNPSVGHWSHFMPQREHFKTLMRILSDLKIQIFCVEFQRVPLKFHTKYLAYTHFYLDVKI